MLIGHCIVILKYSEPWTNKSNCLSCEIKKGMQAKHNTVQVTLALHNCTSASSSSVSYGKCDGWMKNLLALHTCSGIIKNTTTWSRKYSVYISVQKKNYSGTLHETGVYFSNEKRHVLHKSMWSLPMWWLKCVHTCNVVSALVVPWFLESLLKSWRATHCFQALCITTTENW